MIRTGITEDVSAETTVVTTAGVAKGVEAGWTMGAECVGDCEDFEV